MLKVRQKNILLGLLFLFMMVLFIIYCVIGIFVGLFINYTSKLRTDAEYTSVLLGTFWPVYITISIVCLICTGLTNLGERIFDHTPLKKYKHAW